MKTTLQHSRSYEQEPRMSSPGIISRKPQRKAPFARKKCNQYAHGEAKISNFTLRMSKEKRPSIVENIATSKSAKNINCNLQQDIKYLSPKHTQSSLTIVPQNNQPSSTLKSVEKLSNSNHFLGNFSVLSTFDDMVLTDSSPTSSGISLECLIGKKYAIQPTEHSRGDWFGLQTQNDKLKEQNKRLEQEITNLKQELSKCKMILFPPNPSPESAKCVKCKNIVTLERLKAQNKELHATLSHYVNDVEHMKSTIIQLKQQLIQERQAIMLLNMELQGAKHTEEQLQSLMNSLREKMDKDTIELKYLGVQQDMLMRKREEFEKCKQENTRKGAQRQSLRRILTEYKEKVDLLRKVIVKGRNQKKIHKIEDTQLSLELSLDSIISR